MQFSEKLKMFRELYNITQEEMAEYLSVSRQAISKYESGKGYPSINNLLLISSLFYMELDFFLVDRIREYARDMTATEVDKLYFVIEKHTGAKRENITGDSLEKKDVRARYIVKWLCDTLLSTSISPVLGNRNLWIDSEYVAHRIVTDFEYRKQIKEIVDELRMALENKEEEEEFFQRQIRR